MADSGAAACDAMRPAPGVTTDAELALAAARAGAAVVRAGYGAALERFGKPGGGIG
jgi:hypothetical protein